MRSRGADLGDDPEFAAGLRAGEPDAEELFGEIEPGFELGREAVAGVGHGDLRVLSVEGTQVNHTRGLDEVGARKQGGGEVGRTQVLYERVVRGVDGERERFARAARVGVGESGEAFGGFGRGVAVGFDGPRKAAALGGGAEAEGGAKCCGGRGVTGAELDVDELGSGGVLRGEEGRAVGVTAVDDEAHVAQVVFAEECGKGGRGGYVDGLETGFAGGGEAAGEAPRATRGGRVVEGPEVEREDGAGQRGRRLNGEE